LATENKDQQENEDASRRVRRLILELYFEDRNRRPKQIARLLKKRYGIERSRVTVWRVLYENGLNCEKKGRPRGSHNRKRQKRQRAQTRAAQKRHRSKAEQKQRRHRRRSRLLRQRLKVKEIFTKVGGLLIYAPLILETHLPTILEALDVDLDKALLLLNHLLAEGGRVADVKEETDPGLPLSSGLEDIKDDSELHRYLEGINKELVEKIQLEFGKRLHKLGAFFGRGVNVDGHFIPYHGELKIPKGRNGVRKCQQKGFYLWVVCDHHSNGLIYFKVTLCDVKETKILDELLQGAEQILGEGVIEWYCVDRGFYEIGIIGGLGGGRQSFIPAKNTGNVIRAMKEVPLPHFKPYQKRKRLAETTVEIAGQTVRLIVLEVTTKQGERRLFGFLTSDKTLAAHKVVARYSRRWRVENWLKAGKLDLNLDHLPGLTVVYQDGEIVLERLIDKLAAFILFKVIASHIIGLLNQLAGKKYQPKKWRQRFFHQNASWSIHNGRLVVAFHHWFRGWKEFQQVWQAIIERGMSCVIPWLDNLEVSFVFQPS